MPDCHQADRIQIKSVRFVLRAVETRHSSRNCSATRFSSFESLFPGFGSLFRSRYAAADEVPHFCGRERGFSCWEGCASPSWVFGDRTAPTPFFIVTGRLLTASAAVTQFSNLESPFQSSESFFSNSESFSRNCYAVAGNLTGLPRNTERRPCHRRGRSCRLSALPGTAKASDAVSRYSSDECSRRVRLQRNSTTLNHRS